MALSNRHVGGDSSESEGFAHSHYVQPCISRAVTVEEDHVMECLHNNANIRG